MSHCLLRKQHRKAEKRHYNRFSVLTLYILLNIYSLSQLPFTRSISFFLFSGWFTHIFTGTINTQGLHRSLNSPTPISWMLECCDHWAHHAGLQLMSVHVCVCVCMCVVPLPPHIILWSWDFRATCFKQSYRNIKCGWPAVSTIKCVCACVCVRVGRLKSWLQKKRRECSYICMCICKVGLVCGRANAHTCLGVMGGGIFSGTLRQGTGECGRAREGISQTE